MYTKPTLFGVVVRVLVLALIYVWGYAHSTTVPKIRSHPIVADLVANPDAYLGQPIIIYGLVIEADLAHHTFMLQDVSQHPLRVDAHELPPVLAGAQVQVDGKLERSQGKLVLFGESLKPVQVLAGGGCC
jgi:hypothetical protein